MTVEMSLNREEELQSARKDLVKKIAPFFPMLPIVFLQGCSPGQEEVVEAFSPKAIPGYQQRLEEKGFVVTPSEWLVGQAVDSKIDRVLIKEDVAGFDFDFQGQLIADEVIRATENSELPEGGTLSWGAGTDSKGKLVPIVRYYTPEGKLSGLVCPEGETYQTALSPNPENTDLRMFFQQGAIHVFDKQAKNELIREKRGEDWVWRDVSEVVDDYKESESELEVSGQASTTLLEQKIEIPKTIDFVDMDLSINQEMGNWSEDVNLKYGEFAEGIPGYDFSDFSHVENLAELDLALKELYSLIPEVESSPGIRRMELLVNRSVVDEFNSDGVSFVGWANRHVGFFNSLLAESGLDLRISLGRMIIVKDDSVGEIFAEENDLLVAEGDFLWGIGPYSLPPGYFNRWLVTSDYRNGDYYDESSDTSMVWEHEMGHYPCGLWDIYPFNEAGGQTIYVNDGKHRLTPLQVPSLNYPADWLMVGVTARPVLSPFSIQAIERLGELNVSSWEEAYVYWGYMALEEIPEQVYVQFKDSIENSLKEGRVSVFVQRYDEMDKDAPRTYDKNADFVFTLDGEKETVLLPFDPSGYAPVRDSVFYFPGKGKNLVIVIETEDGRLFSTQISSLDFLRATWEAEEGKAPLLAVKMTEVS